MSTANLNSNTESLERRLVGLRSDLQDASDQADRLSDTDTGFDIGCELLDARHAVNAAIDALDRLTAPTQGPRFDAVVHSPKLDAAYAEMDALFA
jgi:hypothetical protein